MDTTDRALIPANEMKERVPGTTDQSWATMRHKGTGPKYVKLNGRIYYRHSDLDEWIESNVRQRTDDKRPPPQGKRPSSTRRSHPGQHDSGDAA
ncbi:hypothetical protein AAFP35_24045 [Gordonia sp. CPCC 206044]|uniref:helix-turn-helix transcriptional regulator n=1 Tax=Gordonia sp. CPCC 206044 TaxID=3140793 RepID=UPI003AF3B593